MSLSPLSKHNIGVALVFFLVSLALLICLIVLPYVDFSQVLDEDRRQKCKEAQRVADFAKYPEQALLYYGPFGIGVIISFSMLMGIVKRNIYLLIPAVLAAIFGIYAGASYAMFMMIGGYEFAIQMGLYIAGALYLFMNPLISVALEILGEKKTKKQLYK